MAEFELSTERWPLVVSVVGGAMSEADYERMFAAWEAVLRRREKFAAMTDARNAKRGDAKQRAVIAAWTKKIDPEVARWSQGHAAVITSAVVRGAMTAIEWLHKPRVPQAYCGTMVEAYDFCIERLREGRVEIPPNLVAYRVQLARSA